MDWQPMKQLMNSLSKSNASAWLNKITQYVNKSEKSLQATQQSIITHHLQALENRFQGAMHFLKKTKIKKNHRRLGLQHLPWYLLIGSSGAGKTTLLANSKINFILEKQFHQNNIQIVPSENCDWWITSDIVLVDVPGRYMTSKGKKNSLSKMLWQHFLELVKKKRGKQALSGIVIALSLEELMTTQNREWLINDLKQSLSELRKKFSNDLPIYFTVTKCDLLPGFLDFFNDYSNEELTQAWGITFPPTATGSLADTFVTRFNALIKRLNSHVLWRLHRERNPFAKFYIKDFPLQLERLKEAIVDVVKALTIEVPINLKGVYLTSATQHIVTEQATTHPELVPAEEFQQSFQIMHNPYVSMHSYFIKQFILQGLA